MFEYVWKIVRENYTKNGTYLSDECVYSTGSFLDAVMKFTYLCGVWYEGQKDDSIVFDDKKQILAVVEHAAQYDRARIGDVVLFKAHKACEH